MAPPLDLGAIAVFFQPGLPALGWVAPIRIDILAGVRGIKNPFEVERVIRLGGIRHTLTSELVLLIDIHRDRVAEVALSMLLGPARIRVFLTALSGRPIGRRGILTNDHLFLAADLLFGRRNQRGINHLSAPGDEAFVHELPIKGLKQRLGTGFANPVLKRPDRGSVRDISCMGQPAEALVTETIQQQKRHPLVGQVIEVFQDHNPDHGLSREWGPTALPSLHTRRNPIDFARQLKKINRSLNLSQWITQMINLLGTLVRGKQVIFDRTGFLYVTDTELIGLATLLPIAGAILGFLRVPFWSILANC